jgi:gluconate 2-dehydrogenase gamma chain
MLNRRNTVKRRKFLGMGLAATGAGTLISCANPGSPRRFFTAAEARTVEAVCEQIIPADQDPGAREAGVLNYIDLQLTRHLKRHQRAYRTGIAAVNAAARSRFGRLFAELPFDRQAEVLAEIEKKERAFFALILDHTMQGFYGDSRHGGNRNQVSWRMVRLPYPPLRGRVSYQPKG